MGLDRRVIIRIWRQVISDTPNRMAAKHDQVRAKLTSLLPRVSATYTIETSVNLWSLHTFSLSIFGQFLMTAINPSSVIPSHLRRFKYFKPFDAIDWMPSLVMCLSLRSFNSSTSQRILDRHITPLSFWRGGVAVGI